MCNLGTEEGGTETRTVQGRLLGWQQCSWRPALWPHRSSRFAAYPASSAHTRTARLSSQSEVRSIIYDHTNPT